MAYSTPTPIKFHPFFVFPHPPQVIAGSTIVDYQLLESLTEMNQAITERSFEDDLAALAASDPDFEGVGTADDEEDEESTGSSPTEGGEEGGDGAGGGVSGERSLVALLTGMAESLASGEF